MTNNEVFTREEYIEREALLTDIEACVRITSRPDHPSAELRGANKVISRIMAVPAADVVEVVRCKECRFCVHDKGFDELWCNGKRRNADWFCADGERMDGDGE